MYMCKSSVQIRGQEDGMDSEEAVVAYSQISVSFVYTAFNLRFTDKAWVPDSKTKRRNLYSNRQLHLTSLPSAQCAAEGYPKWYFHRTSHFHGHCAAAMVSLIFVSLVTPPFPRSQAIQHIFAPVHVSYVGIGVVIINKINQVLNIKDSGDDFPIFPFFFSGTKAVMP